MFPVLLVYNLVALLPIEKYFSLYMFHMFNFIHNITIDAVYYDKILIKIWNILILLIYMLNFLVTYKNNEIIF